MLLAAFQNALKNEAKMSFLNPLKQLQAKLFGDIRDFDGILNTTSEITVGFDLILQITAVKTVGF